MYYKQNIIALMLLGTLCCCSPQKDPVNLIFTGDVILARGVSDKLRIYGDTLLSQRLKPLLGGGFVAINLETVLTTDTIPKTKGIVLRADPSLAKALKAGGVDNVFMSNNHALDFGADGLESTRNHLEKAGLQLDKDVSKIIEGRNIYIMAHSLLEIENFERSSKINRLIGEVYDKSHGKYKRPTILYLHWGVEYQSGPTEAQRELAHRLIDAGADVIIGHHPHVFQTIEFYKHKPIIYSLGNFVADAYLPGTTQGAMVSIHLRDTLGHVAIKPIDLSDYCVP